MPKKAKRSTPPDPPQAPADVMQIERVPLSDLTLDPQNAKAHGERDLAVTGSSLEEFQQIEPLIVWKGTVLAGNGRLMKMRQLGWTHAEIRRVDHLSEPQARKLAIVLNRSAQLAPWSETQLLQTLRELETLDVSLPDMGFDDADMQALVDDAMAATVKLEDVGDSPAQSDKRDLGDPLKQIKPVLYADQIHVFEAALRATGIKNRGQALIEVCKGYLNEKGQLDTPAESQPAASRPA